MLARLVVLSLVTLVFAFIADGAVRRQGPTVEYDTRGTAVAIRGLYSTSDGPADPTCPQATWAGRIVHVRYDEVTATRIVGITIEDRKKTRDYLTLDESLYSQLSAADLAWVPKLLRVGNRVKVSAFGCGAAGRVQMLDAVTVLR